MTVQGPGYGDAVLEYRRRLEQGLLAAEEREVLDGVFAEVSSRTTV